MYKNSAFIVHSFLLLLVVVVIQFSIQSSCEVKTSTSLVAESSDSYIKEINLNGTSMSRIFQNINYVYANPISPHFGDKIILQ